MEPIQIFLRIKNRDEVEGILLYPNYRQNTEKEDILWEASGDYYLEAFQCGTHPSICSIEKDPRILNPKEEIALLILDEIGNTIGLEA